MGDGIRQGIGVLSAFKDALEETIQEARERGDLSSERAKEVMKETLERAQGAAEGAKEKLDFASQADMDSVRTAVDSIKERLAELEESVFGASKESAAEADSASKTEGGADDS
jgi:polyhydroxyalkanoate synthesis regulator phasin